MLHIYIYTCIYTQPTLWKPQIDKIEPPTTAPCFFVHWWSLAGRSPHAHLGRPGRPKTWWSELASGSKGRAWGLGALRAHAMVQWLPNLVTILELCYDYTMTILWLYTVAILWLYCDCRIVLTLSERCHCRRLDLLILMLMRRRCARWPSEHLQAVPIRSFGVDEIQI